MVETSEIVVQFDVEQLGDAQLPVGRSILFQRQQRAQQISVAHRGSVERRGGHIANPDSRQDLEISLFEPRSQPSLE